MGEGTIDLRAEREARLRGEIERLKRLERLQIVDRADADIAIAALEDELEGAAQQRRQQ
jgi:hypothetical protein